MKNYRGELSFKSQETGKVNSYMNRRTRKVCVCHKSTIGDGKIEIVERIMGDNFIYGYA